jgi:hypothetical protein
MPHFRFPNLIDLFWFDVETKGIYVSIKYNKDASVKQDSDICGWQIEEMKKSSTERKNLLLLESQNIVCNVLQ